MRTSILPWVTCDGSGSPESQGETLHWITTRIKWVMLVSGALTFTMIYAAFSPTQALQSAFGESLEGPVANIVVRNWGALIALVGAMLVYGAFRPAVRPLVHSRR